MGRVVELKGRNGEYIPSFVSIDKLTNEVVAMRVENAFIPKEIKGVQLTEQEQNDLREGKKIFVEGMIPTVERNLMPISRSMPSAGVSNTSSRTTSCSTASRWVAWN